MKSYKVFWTLGLSILWACSHTQESTDSFVRYQAATQAGEACGKDIKRLVVSADGEWPEENKIKLNAVFNQCLQTYSAQETHTTSLEFLEGALQALEIPSQTSNKDSASHLMAQIHAKDNAPTVVLLHSTDLYNSQRVSTASEQKFLWGQKKSDIKSLGVLQLFSLAFAQKQKEHLNKNLIFIATETGEIDDLLSQAPSAEVILNDSGYSFEKQEDKVFLIGAESPGGAWMKLRHASPTRLLSHLDQLMAVFLPHEPQDFKDFGKCQLTSFSTDQQKITSIPYKVDFEVECKGVNELQVGQAFAHRNVSFLGKKEDGKYFISLELSHPEDHPFGELSALQVAAQGFQKLSMIPYRDWSFEEPTFYKHIRTPASVAFVKTVKKVLPSLSPWSSVLWNLDSSGEWTHAGQEITDDKKNRAEKMFRTSCAWTGFESNEKGSEATVDCRLVHTGSNNSSSAPQAQTFIKNLKDKAKDPALTIDLVRGWNYVSSDSHTPTYAILQNQIKKQYPKAEISPWMAPVGLTLDHTQRVGKSMPTYGLNPLLHNEFLGTELAARSPSEEQIYSALQIYTGTVAQLLK